MLQVRSMFFVLTKTDGVNQSPADHISCSSSLKKLKTIVIALCNIENQRGSHNSAACLK